MTSHAFLRRAGNPAFRRIGLLLATVLVLGGCGTHAQSLAVRAVAAGVPSLAPFFDERSGLGQDTTVRIREVPGGLQAGSTPGLYGGSRRPTVCDVERLKEFLTDPRNDRKAKAWSQVEGITPAQIPGYLDGLTPVLLRHDTLVQNHEYRKGRAIPFDSVLQAGIAVLVDQRGQPVVKCSCGNPLRPFRGDTTRISVKFGDGNGKWPGYDRASVVTIRPAPARLKRLALVDVDDPDRGIERPVGTGGGHDSAFDTRVRHTVPDVTGTGFAGAVQRLTAAGLAVAYAGQGAPPDGAVITGMDPAPGTELGFGRYVTLSVATGDTDGPGGAAPGGTSPDPKDSTPSSPSASFPSASSPSDAVPSTGGTASGETGMPPRSSNPVSPPGSGVATSSSSGDGTPSGGLTSPRESGRPSLSGSATPASSTPATGPPARSSSADPPARSSSTGPPATTSASLSGTSPTHTLRASTPPTRTPRTGQPTADQPMTGSPPAGAPSAGTATTWNNGE
ncbi:DUF6777 domain-containing protein [Streptomyces sp. NPDC047022]|uniref:DUF6777 domain-containing protein n=1 Tax=Streptomyces sp. NPDC047022 TaxID=3155737 RepID=UPI0033C78CD5